MESSQHSVIPGLPRRLAAMLYDVVLVAGVLFLAGIPLLLVSGIPNTPFIQWTKFVYLLCVVFVFLAWFWTHGGQTLGMRAWRLQVVTLAGRNIGWSDAAKRYVMACLSLGLFGLGFFWILIDKEKRAWHDIASSTRIRLLEKSSR